METVDMAVTWRLRSWLRRRVPREGERHGRKRLESRLTKVMNELELP
jgi:hypothetical protein